MTVAFPDVSVVLNMILRRHLSLGTSVGRYRLTHGAAAADSIVVQADVKIEGGEISSRWVCVGDALRRTCERSNIRRSLSSCCGSGMASSGWLCNTAMSIPSGTFWKMGPVAGLFVYRRGDKWRAPI